MARKRISKKSKLVFVAAPVVVVLGWLSWYFHTHTVAVLSPAGVVARKERNLMVVALILSAVVVLPVFAMTIAIALRFRESNHVRKMVKYTPDWDQSRLLESLWWGIPCTIILTLSIITWNSSHALDPYKPLVSSVKPLTVQVICLDWKWLFIYPEQHVASVNLVELPVNTPVNFEITSDAVMNSFWIPQLGGQIYAMPGMSTQLHLMASRTGMFVGSPANISGVGFARMDFSALSVTNAAFQNWVLNTQASHNLLNQATYEQLAKPSDDYPVTYYSLVQNDLYNKTVMKYMMPDSESSSAGMSSQPGPNSSMPGMSMP